MLLTNLRSSRSVGMALSGICPGGVRREVDLKTLSRWRIGGTAAWMVEPSSSGQVASIVDFARPRGIPTVVVGDGSNLLFDDEGLEAIVIKIGRRMSSFSINGNDVLCQAGAWVPSLARNVANAGLSGMEHVIGIPGTIGGLVYMNGGTQRRGIGESIVRVTAVMPDATLSIFEQDQCGFEYRHSVFQQEKGIITEAHLRFKPGDKAASRREMISMMKSRRHRFPLKLPNCGSVFVSDPAMYQVIGAPGQAIESVGLKGLRVGGARISEQHANFIVNEDNASSSDVLKLISLIRRTIEKETGFNMKVEIKYVTRDARMISGEDCLCEIHPR